MASKTFQIRIVLTSHIIFLIFWLKIVISAWNFWFQLGNSTSITQNLQSVSFELAENLQAYSVLKDIKFCKSLAPKSHSGALWIFEVFTVFRLVFDSFVYFWCNKPQELQKNIQKYVCKISRSIEFRWQNCTKLRRKAGKSEKPLYFWKIHNAKIPFLNLLKLGRDPWP